MGAIAPYLVAAKALIDMQQTSNQAKTQAAVYNAQASAARQNAAIKSAEASRTAESYAGQQKKLNDRLRLVRGQQAAAAGASGVNASAGSVLDTLTAADLAHQEDSQDLLRNQRTQTWSDYVQEVNYRNQANNYDSMASSVKSAAKAKNFATLLGAAGTIYGMGGSSASSVDNTSNVITLGNTSDYSGLTSSWYNGGNAITLSGGSNLLTKNKSLFGNTLNLWGK